MASMFDLEVRIVFQRRIRSLRPDAQRRWGKMTTSQWVGYLADLLRIALGQLATQPIGEVLRYSPMRQLVIDVLPWPKGRIQGPPEAFTSSPDRWERDVATLLALLETFGGCGRQGMWAPHPNFGRMSGPLWGRLTCRCLPQRHDSRARNASDRSSHDRWRCGSTIGPEIGACDPGRR